MPLGKREAKVPCEHILPVTGIGEQLIDYSILSDIFIPLSLLYTQYIIISRHLQENITYKYPPLPSAKLIDGNIKTWALSFKHLIHRVSTIYPQSGDNLWINSGFLPE